MGSLRLLRNDPFYDVLARNGWLRALDPDYVAEIRELLGSIPLARRKSPPHRGGPPPARRADPPPPPTPQPRHPGLFEGVG